MADEQVKQVEQEATAAVASTETGVIAFIKAHYVKVAVIAVIAILVLAVKIL